VVIEIADTGHGMSAETRRRIFDPFFTTRVLGRGLSLAAVEGILRGHRATIAVESEAGRGSRFRVYFPALVPRTERTQRVSGERAAKAGKDRAATAREVILVVDDEPTVRDLARRVLERAGFAVETAADGVDGVATVRLKRHELAAVLLDVIMPRLGGRDAVQEMRQLVPDLPIVLMSGFTAEADVAGVRALGGVEFLGKPFAAEVLVRTVRALIDARATRAPQQA